MLWFLSGIQHTLVLLKHYICLLFCFSSKPYRWYCTLIWFQLTKCHFTGALHTECSFIRGTTDRIIPVLHSHTNRITLVQHTEFHFNRSFTYRISHYRSFTYRMSPYQSFTYQMPPYRSFTYRMSPYRSFTYQMPPYRSFTYRMSP